ncbi:MAG: hypothetical protein ABI548_16835 [Polyangiaceae bacterium]
MSHTAVAEPRRVRPQVSEETRERESTVPREGDERKRRMSAIIAQVVEEDRAILLELAR